MDNIKKSFHIKVKPKCFKIKKVFQDQDVWLNFFIYCHVLNHASAGEA